MIDAMDGWQRSNLKETYSRYYPRGTNTSDCADENFDIFMLRIGVDLLKDQESKSPLAESFTTKPSDHSHPGFRNDYKDPSAQGTYHAYPRPELKTETKKVKLKRRFKDLGDVKYVVQPCPCCCFRVLMASVQYVQLAAGKRTPSRGLSTPVLGNWISMAARD